MDYGYARVSSKNQKLDRQTEALKNAGIDQKYIYVEKISGKNFERVEYQKLMKKIKKGDVLFVKSVDRLGRNYNEIIEQWHYINKVLGADIVVLDFELLDTRKNYFGLTGRFISDMVLQIMSYVAQIERENILERQQEGILCAKTRGIRFGRPKKPFPEEFESVYMLWKEKRISKREASRRLFTNTTLFSRWVNDFEKQMEG